MKFIRYIVIFVAVTIISVVTATAVSAQDYEYTWGLDEWLSSGTQYYNITNLNDAYNTDSALNPPPHYSSGYKWSDQPLSPLKTPSNFEESLYDGNTYIHGQTIYNNSGRLSTDRYAATGYYEYDKAWYNNLYSSGGPWYDVTGNWDNYRRDSIIYYRRPIPTWMTTGIGGSTYYSSSTNTYWYPLGGYANITGVAQDNEGQVRNIRLTLLDSSSNVGVCMQYNNQNNTAADLNSGSAISGFSMNKNANSTVYTAQNVLTCTGNFMTPYTIYALADNRAGANAQSNYSSFGFNTGYKVEWDTQAPGGYFYPYPDSNSAWRNSSYILCSCATMMQEAALNLYSSAIPTMVVQLMAVGRVRYILVVTVFTLL